MIDDSNCHCGPCTAMNEPLTLEGDIRYLKAHIETKDRQLADANKRIDIYREAWRDAEGAAIRLDKKNSQLLTRITELEDTIMRLGEEKRIGGLGHNLGLQQENLRLREENERLKRAVEISVEGHTQTDAKLVELAHENKKLRKEKEILVNDRTSLVEEANELYEAIGRISGIVNEIID